MKILGEESLPILAVVVRDFIVLYAVFIVAWFVAAWWTRDRK